MLGARAISTVARRGYRFAELASAGSAPHDSVRRNEAGHREATSRTLAMPPQQAWPAAVAPLRVPTHNLQAARNRFIGRKAALLDCHRLLQDTRLLSLTGMGGCGKTRLAGQLAGQCLATQADGGVWWVDLAPLPALSADSPTLARQRVAATLARQRVAATLAATLGLQEEAGTPLLARLIAQLAPRSVLIVLDNCEHVAAAAGDLVSALLAHCGRLKIIVTSRQALGLDGEQIYPVPPLLLPAGSGLGAVLAAEAVGLFVDRARLVLPGFVVDADNAAGIADICIQLDGIALALELAAAWVPLLSIEEIRARLGQRFELLTGVPHAQPRHQTLQAAMHWSCDTLPPPAQALFAGLSVFAAGCTLRGACFLASDAGGAGDFSQAGHTSHTSQASQASQVDEYAVLRLLTRLHDKSLLRVDPPGLSALPLLASPSATPPLPTRYRMLETVRQYAPVRASTRKCAWSRPATPTAAATAAAAASASASTTPTAPARPVNPRDQCRVLLGPGQTAFRMGRFEETRACAEQGLALALAADDSAQLPFAHGLLANALSALGQPQLALARFEQARSAARAVGDFSSWPRC